MRVLPILLLTLSLATAQTRQEKGKQVIDEAIAALGGDNFLGLKIKVEKGRMYSFYNQKLTGLTRATIYTKYLTPAATPDPNDLYIRERQAFGKQETWSYVFTEEDGYEVTYRGAKPLLTETVERFRDSRQRDIFYILLRRLDEEGLIIEYHGSDVVDNRPMRAVDITDSENRVVTVWFHYSTKLPARQIFYRRDKTRFRHEEVTIFDKYRDVGGGVNLPFVVQRERNGERIFSMYADSVEINLPLTDEVFLLPGDIKMLERQK